MHRPGVHDSGQLVGSKSAIAQCRAEQTTRISVMVLNTAAVPDQTLSEAQKQAGKILGHAGVDVEWIDCQLPVNAPVRTAAAESDRLLLTIVAEDNRQMFGEDVLGRSVVGGSNKGSTQGCSMVTSRERPSRRV